LLDSLLQERIPRMTAIKGQQVDDQAKELRIGKDKRCGSA